MADAPDLSLLLTRSIKEARDQRSAARLWSNEELESVHQQLDEEIWRVRARSLVCSR